MRLGQWLSPTSGYLWILIVVAILTLYVMDVYRLSVSHGAEHLPLNTFVAVIVVFITSVFVTYAFGVDQFTSIFGRGVLPVALAMFAIWAAICRLVFSRWHKSTHAVVNWLLICSDHTFSDFIQDNQEKYPELSAEHIGVDESGEQIKQWLEDNPRKSGIIFDSDTRLAEDISNQLIAMRTDTIPILTISEFYERFWTKLPVLNLGEGWFLRNRGFNLLHDSIGIRLKRVADFLLGVTGIIITLPLIPAIAGLIYLESPGGVIFKQRRVGLNGEVFTLYKFRSMIESAESVGAQWSEVDDPRITRLGKFLRASRLDELPQFWNLILGNMSLIGPRPERPEFVEQLKQEIPYYDLRHLVPPGLTGWAQVMYSYGSTVEDARKKLEYDLYYIKNHSLRLDLAIILRTFIVILKGLGR